MRFLSKPGLVLIAMGVSITPLFAQVPPPVATPIDGFAGIVAVILVGTGLVAKKYLKRHE